MQDISEDAGYIQFKTHSLVVSDLHSENKGSKFDSNCYLYADC